MNRPLLYTGMTFGLSLISLVTVAIAQSPGNVSQSSVSENIEISFPLTPIEAGDSMQNDKVQPIISEAERMIDLATTLYKEVKFKQYEGETESVLCEAAYMANDQAIKALIMAATPEFRNRAVNIITDLNPLLLRGAINASSNGDQQGLVKFARAYVDSQLLPETADVDFHRDSGIFPTVVYNAAYGATQEGDVDKAKNYFRLYITTGDTKMREQIFTYLAQAYMQTRDYKQALEVVEEAVSEFPTNISLVNIGIQSCLDGQYYEHIQPLLDRALMLAPNDEKLLNIHAKMLERHGEFKEALDIYRNLAETHPNSLENTRRIGICLYNLGAYYYNQSIMEHDEKASGRARRQSKVYFTDATKVLEEILANTPADTDILRALGQTYASLGDRTQFDSTNTRLQALGQRPLMFNDMPSMIGEVVSGDDNNAAVIAENNIPSFEQFAKEYIEPRLATWALRGEFEKIDDYRKRMAGGGGVNAFKALNEEAAKAYLDKYAKSFTLKDLKRSDYDIENETYSISTPYGETVIKVPLKNKEAEAFKAGWETAQIRAPRFIIRDGQVGLAEITYIVNGKKYQYSSADAANYRTPSVYVDVNGILEAAMYAEGSAPGAGQSSPSTLADGVWTESDVDCDIPVTSKKNSNNLALIIANEKYSKASDVFGALHDGATMREYCVRTLGIPEGNVTLLNNATGNQIIDAIDQLSRRVKGIGPEAEVIFYYAGHGLPDDATKEAYLLPVDANPLNMATLTPMKEIYRRLGNMDASAVQVFLDACFSGESREGKPVNESRGVALRAQPVAPQGNMFVLSAASAQETAMPYKEKHHGLFTYYLLKKLQESKGNATLRQISDYVIKSVRDTSNSNPAIGKEQNPTVNVSGKLASEWESKKLK